MLHQTCKGRKVKLRIKYLLGVVKKKKTQKNLSASQGYIYAKEKKKKKGRRGKAKLRNEKSQGLLLNGQEK